MTTPTEIYLLDVGTERYGDSLLCIVAGRSILVDGGHPGDWDGSDEHPSIPDQLTRILDVSPAEVDLLVVSHAHRDHVGCLPKLVDRGLLSADWAFLPSPERAWPAGASDDPALAGMREENLMGLNHAELGRALAEAAALLPAYELMVETLRERGTRIVFHGDDTAPMLEEFAGAGLAVLGPTLEQLELGRRRMAIATKQAEAVLESSPFLALSADPVERYRALMSAARLEVLEAVDRDGAAVNVQSAVLTIGEPGGKILLAGDMQFADPELSGAAGMVEQLWDDTVRAGPYAFVKLSHHGSPNANPGGFVSALRCRTFGVCAGVKSDKHPSGEVLRQLDDAEAAWARTDRNGLSRVTLTDMGATINVARGSANDARSNE